MRITNNGMAERILSELQDNLRNVANSEQQVATGLKLNKPSDDPVSTGELIRLRTSISRQDQYIRNMESGLSQLKMTSSELGSINDILIQARALAVQGANDTLDEDDRNGLAEEVDQSLQELLRIANQKYGSRYLFGGSDTTQKPYESEETGEGWIEGVYSNIPDDEEDMELYFDEDKKVEIQLNGNKVFDLGNGSNVFDVLIQLREALATNDPAAVGDRLPEIDEALEKVSNAIALVGSRINTSDDMMERLEERKINLVSRQSSVGDADLAEVITRLNEEKLVYELGLSTASSVLKTSLLDYL